MLPPTPVPTVADPPMRQADAASTPKRTIQPARQQRSESPELTSQRTPASEKLCCCCKEVKVIPPVTRCKPCHKVFNRINNAKKRMDPKYIDAWDNLPRSKKLEFTNEVNDLTGRNLMSRLRQYLGADMDSRESIALSGNGRFLDSPDLADKYKNKPQRLEAIRANTRAMVCPMSGSTLYEDMQYKSAMAIEPLLSKKRRMNYLAEGTTRPLKKLKVDPKAKRIAAGAEKTNKLNENQQERLDGCLEFLKKSQKLLEEHEADIKNLGKFIPPVTKDTLKDAQNLVNAMQELCGEIEESGQCRDFITFWNSMCESKKKLVQQKAALDKKVKAAKAASGEKPPPGTKARRKGGRS